MRLLHQRHDHAGGLAVAQSGDRLTYLVYVTQDGGRIWHGPTQIANAPRKVGFKPWVAFSPEGVLGFVWRADDAPPAEVPYPKPEVQPKHTFPYALWGVISADGGLTFSSPLLLSGGHSPAPRLGELGPPDDESFVTLGRNDMHYAWGDWREGDLSAWYGRMPLAKFGSARRRGGAVAGRRVACSAAVEPRSRGGEGQ